MIKFILTSAIVASLSWITMVKANEPDSVKKAKYKLQDKIRAANLQYRRAKYSLDRIKEYRNGKCNFSSPSNNTLVPIPNLKCEKEKILKEQVACYSLAYGQYQCAEEFKKQHPELAKKFTARLAIATACEQGIESEFALKYIPTGIAVAAVEDHLSTSCKNIESNNLLAKLYGIAACTSKAFSIAQKVDAANLCSKMANHYCDEKFLSDWHKHQNDIIRNKKINKKVSKKKKNCEDHLSNLRTGRIRLDKYCNVFLSSNFIYKKHFHKQYCLIK